MRSVARAVEHRRRHQHGRAVLGQHESPGLAACGDRGAERVPRRERVAAQHRVWPRGVGRGVVALPPHEARVGIDVGDEVETRGLDGRRGHVVVDEGGMLARHEAVGLEPVAPVGAEELQLLQLAMERTSDAFHVGARKVLLERLEARQDHLALHEVIDGAERGQHRAQQQYHLGIKAHLGRGASLDLLPWILRAPAGTKDERAHGPTGPRARGGGQSVTGSTVSGGRGFTRASRPRRHASSAPACPRAATARPRTRTASRRGRRRSTVHRGSRRTSR